MVAFKERVLAGVRERCSRTVLAADLRGDWPAVLAAAGFDPAGRTAWLAEGLLIYLTRAEGLDLFTAIGAGSAPGSRLALEVPTAASEAFVDRVRAIPELNRLTELWQGGLGMDTATWRPVPTRPAPSSPPDDQVEPMNDITERELVSPGVASSRRTS